MPNNFSLQRLLGRKEDHLTAMFALAIELDVALRERTAALLLSALPRIGDEIPRIANIEVQRAFALGTPDVVLTLEDGRLVAIENKLEAPETQAFVPDGESQSEKMKTPQLAKYLKIPDLAALAFVRATYKPPSADVIANPRYLRPANDRGHFLWRDFVPLMQDSTHPVTSWLREAFRVNGFVLPDPTIGDLDAVDRQHNFKLLWESTADLARKLGWKVGTGSTKELYFSAHPSSIADLVWANPTTGQLLLRVRPRSAGDLAQVRSRIEDVCDAMPEPQRPSVELARVGRGADRRTVVDILASLEAVVGRASPVSVISERLTSFVGSFLRVL